MIRNNDGNKKWLPNQIQFLYILNMEYYISHRGNLSGTNPERENDPTYIEEALDLGFEVEIDVWWGNEKFFLGHDYPQYEVEESFLENVKLWCHAKNQLGLEKMLENEKIHCFWHQTDNYTLTSKGFIWVYPGIRCPEKSICVSPEDINNIPICSGVCSDFIQEIRDRHNTV
jgi:hypothetical protein